LDYRVIFNKRIDEGKLIIAMNGFQKKTNKTPKSEIEKAQRIKKQYLYKSSKLKSFRNHLDEEYGLVGTKSRTAYEKGFEAFKLGVLLQDLK
jgi:hypothetical protein